MYGDRSEFTYRAVNGREKRDLQVSSGSGHLSTPSWSQTPMLASAYSPRLLPAHNGSKMLPPHVATRVSLRRPPQLALATLPAGRGRQAPKVLCTVQHPSSAASAAGTRRRLRHEGIGERRLNGYSVPSGFKFGVELELFFPPSVSSQEVQAALTNARLNWR